MSTAPAARVAPSPNQVFQRRRDASFFRGDEYERARAAMARRPPPRRSPPPQNNTRPPFPAPGELSPPAPSPASEGSSPPAEGGVPPAGDYRAGVRVRRRGRP